ncbi:hypothetical protein [Spiroplasma endosymbiont of Lasioglossum villosulum]
MVGSNQNLGWWNRGVYPTGVGCEATRGNAPRNLMIMTLMIMTLVTNILVRDNWILINILKVLGYNTMEVSYNFIIIVVPLILIFSVFSIFITPILINILAQQLITFSHVIYPIIFRWWYFLLAFGINIIVYISAYIITWLLNFRKYKLWAFME